MLLQGDNCNCTGPNANLTLQQQQEFSAASLDGVVIDPATSDCIIAAAQTTSTKSFTHRQAGPYAVFTLVGFAVGVILAIATNFIWNTLAGKGRGMPGGNMKFQTFETQGAQG